MQKKLIALAVAGAFAAPAFAATANVDIYGQINVSLDSVSDGDDRWSRMVTNNNSFIGFKGAEDLGGGLSAIWQIEANINIDGNESNAKDAGNMFGTRNTYIGLKSKSFGTVVGGVHDTPYKMATGPLDIFVGTLGDYNGIMGSAGVLGSNPSAVMDLRTGNTIAYLSPDWSGFNFKAAYVLGLEGEASAAADESNAYSLSGTYSNGPLFVTAAYEKHQDVGTVNCNAGATCLGQGSGDRDAWKIGASYKFGGFKIGAMYESMDSDDIASFGTYKLSQEHDSWMINASYNTGAMTFKGEYISAGELDDINDSGANMWALGFDYALSKRTLVQLTYAKMSNDKLGGWALGQGPQVKSANTSFSYPGATGTYSMGEDPSGFSLGIRHSF